MKPYQSGQVLILVIFITAILFGLLAFSAGLINWMQVKNQTESTCRKHYLKSQSYALKYFNRLKKLNPKARKLRYKLILLYAKLATAKDPVSIASILFQIKQTKTKQSLLDAKQKSIIEIAKYKIRLQKELFRNELSRISHIKIQKIQKVKFQTTAKPPMSKAPTYHLPANYKNTQLVQAQWSWFELIYFKQLFEFSCQVGVTKKGFKWVPSMKRAKPLLSVL